MGSDTTQTLGICKPLYQVPLLFPKSVEKGTWFYVGMLIVTVSIVLWMIMRVRRQQTLLRNGEIRVMKAWILPVYMRYLNLMIAVYCLRAVDIAIAYVAYGRDFQSGMPLWFALIHAGCFWTAEFWLFDSLILFLSGDNHGTAAIKRSLWVSTFIWLISAAIITEAIQDPHAHAFWNFVAVFGAQCVIIVCLAMSMYCDPKPHHRHLAPLLGLQFMSVSLRLICDAHRAEKIDAFCLMDISDYFSGIALPYLIIRTLRADSEHWSAVQNDMISRNRHSIYGAMTERVFGSERPSMSAWSELLSQHTKILPSNMIIPFRTQTSSSMVGGSGRVVKARYKSRTVAVKEWRFQKFTTQVIALWCKEALISSNFRHKNVVSLVGICIEPPSIKIVMEWCKYGSLRRFLTSRTSLSWSMRFKFICDIAEGMNHLHRNGLVHRDLKTLNLLIDQDLSTAFGSLTGPLATSTHPIGAAAVSSSSSSSGLLSFAGSAVDSSVSNTKPRRTGSSKQVFEARSVRGATSSSASSLDSRPSRNYLIKICDFGSSRSVDFGKYYDGSGESALSFPYTSASNLSGSGLFLKAQNHSPNSGIPGGLASKRGRNTGGGRSFKSTRQMKSMRRRSDKSGTPSRSATDKSRLLGGLSPVKDIDGSSELVNSEGSFVDDATASRTKRSSTTGLLSRIAGRISTVIGGTGSHTLNDDNSNELDSGTLSELSDEALDVYGNLESNTTPSHGASASPGVESKDSSLNDDSSQLLATDLAMDFSLTSVLLHEISASMSTIVGSVQFLPPEILKNIEFKEGTRHAKSIRKSVYGFSADVYSFGCVIWEILTLREIYKGAGYIAIQRAVLRGERPEVLESDLLECPDSKFLLDLMNSCWAQHSSRRPNFPQIIQALTKHKGRFGF